jgi:hypothetical protein
VDRLAASGRPRPCRTAPRRAVLAGAATRRDWPAGGRWRPSWPGVVVPSSFCSRSLPPWPGWSFAPMSRDARTTNMCWSTGYQLTCPADVPTERGSAAGPGPDAPRSCTMARLTSSRFVTRLPRQPSRSPGPPSLGEPGELVGLRSRNIPVIPTAGLAGLAGFIPLIQMLSDRFGFVPEPTGIDLNMSQWSVPGELSETGRSCDSLGMNAHVIPPRPGRWVTSDLKAGWYDQLPGPALRGPAGTWPSAPRATHSRT